MPLPPLPKKLDIDDPKTKNYFLALQNSITDFAPANASYIVRTANTDLTNEQALGSLASGFIKVTTGTGVLSSTGNALIQTSDLSLTGVANASYGTATQVPSFTVGADGRITTASNTTISGVAPGGNAGGDLSGTYPNPAISASWAGSTGITTLGTISTGTWNGSVHLGTYGGTGVNNGAKTLTYLKNISFTAADDTGVYTLPTGTKTLVPTSTDISSAGIVTKTNNVAFAASATTDTTNASNISSGTLAAARGGVPTTTKGDLATYSTVSDRLPVGSNGQVLSSDSTQTTGLKWIAAGGTGTVTSVTASTGLSGGVITSSGTIALLQPIWAQGSITGSNGAIKESIGVTSCTRNSTGNYTVTLSRTMGSSTYPVIACGNSNTSPTFAVISRTTTTFVVACYTSSTGSSADNDFSFIVLGT